MPELPEVETTVRLIRPHVVGRVVCGTRVGWARALGPVSRRAFARRVAGAEVLGVWRRGKYIVLELGRGGAPAGCLVGHLRMSGRMLVEPRGVDPGPYARVSLALDDGSVFHFVDVRKFGRLVWAAHPEEVFAELGPEPLGEDFTGAWLAGALRARRRLLKPLLLDQSFVAGLGNIYVDEALFAARLHPLARSERVSRARALVLCEAIRAVLTEAIAREGSSFDAFYRTPAGRPGSYQHQFQVYGRQGQPCRACGGAIRRLVVGQRGTHVCPRCQRRPRARAAKAGMPGRGGGLGR